MLQCRETMVISWEEIIRYFCWNSQRLFSLKYSLFNSNNYVKHEKNAKKKITNKILSINLNKLQHFFFLLCTRRSHAKFNTFKISLLAANGTCDWNWRGVNVISKEKRAIYTEYYVFKLMCTKKIDVELSSTSHFHLKRQVPIFIYENNKKIILNWIIFHYDHWFGTTSVQKKKGKGKKNSSLSEKESCNVEW